MAAVVGAVFAGMALFFVVRLLVSRQAASGSRGSTGPRDNDPSADVSHGVMSLGMAAMFWPWGDLVPARYWQVLFSMAAAWFAVRSLRRSATISPSGSGQGTDTHHVLGNLAMVYMLASAPAGHHMTHGMHIPGPGIALPALAWAFVAYFLVFAVWLGAQLVEPVSIVATTPGVVTSPHLLGSSRIVMGIGMSYMLVTML